MPRAIWSGTISFGLVSIPIKLFGAVSRKSVHFNQIDTRTNSRIKQKRVSEADGSEVPPEALAKGYQLAVRRVRPRAPTRSSPRSTRRRRARSRSRSSSTWPTSTRSSTTPPTSSRPDQATLKPYALLQRAMEESGKVGIARFVMRTKQYLAAIRPVDGRLMLSTMVYADELNDPAEIPELDAVADIEVSDKEVAMAQQLIESLGAEFEPGRFRDTYRDQVLELIDRKASGATEIVDRAGGAGRGQGRRPHVRARGERGRGQGGPQAPPERRGRRRRPRTDADGGPRRPSGPPPSGPTAKKATSPAPAKKAAKRPAKKVAARKSA